MHTDKYTIHLAMNLLTINFIHSTNLPKYFTISIISGNGVKSYAYKPYFTLVYSKIC